MFGAFSAITVRGLLYIQAHRFITIIRYSMYIMYSLIKPSIICFNRNKNTNNEDGKVVMELQVKKPKLVGKRPSAMNEKTARKKNVNVCNRK